jgi:serine/threonine-protein kinase
MRINGEPLVRGALEAGGLVSFGELELRLQRAAGAQLPPALNDTAIAKSLKVGVVVEGRYEVVSKLAVGGMGEVYKARHIELDKPVVLKVMRLSMSNDEQLVARFKREAIAATRIGQQNIVDVSDFGRTHDGRFFFVMEYLDGVTLKQLIAAEGRLPLARVTRLSLQIANALEAAHAQGVVHRDLKPENLMVLQRPGQTDFIKVLDFGVAKVKPAAGEAGHTSFGMLMGTPQYMSPEQARAVTLDSRSDVYSLGLVIYEMIVGRPTFSAETPSLLMVKHLTEPPPAFEARLAAKLPAEVERLVHRMLAKDPADRPQTMAEVHAALEVIDVAARGVWAAAGATLIGAQAVAVPQRAAVQVDAPPTAAAAGATAVLARPVTVTVTPTVEDEEAPISLPRRSPWPLAAVVVAGVLTIVGFAVWPRGEPVGATVVRPTAPNDAPAPNVTPPEPVSPVLAPAPAPAPVTVTVTVTLTVTGPSQADVFEGDVLLGRTPLPLTRPIDSVVALTLKAEGFTPLTRRVGFVSAQALVFDLQKLPVVPVAPHKPGSASPSSPATKPYPFND